MEQKKDILWRVYLCFLGLFVFGLAIVIKAVFIQVGNDGYWGKIAQQQRQRVQEIDADRGTIYSEDGSMLSTSVPYFNIYIDFMADGLRQKNGKRFKDNIDSLSYGLAKLFGDKSAQAYKHQLEQGYQKKSRYYAFKKNVSFEQFKKFRNLPLVKLGQNRSGFIVETKDKRVNPFGLLANRTIGLSREFIDSEGKVKNTNVGLERVYDSVLRGEIGTQLVKRIAPGVYAPIDGSGIEPKHGKDLVTTIDVNIQDIAENALLKMMVENEAVTGTCIVMEVATGKIKAIANLGRTSDGGYWEVENYAITATEPGSTFKLATLLAVLEDKKATLDTKVDLEKGQWKIKNRTVYDSEKHGLNEVTVKKAFESSSNVGMAKLVTNYYSQNPQGYVDHLKKLRFDQLSGLNLTGESKPVVKNPKNKSWSAVTLPWMSFGYEILVSPLQTLMLYNAVANNGKMMKPYLVNAITDGGNVIETFKPSVLVDQICSPETLEDLKKALEGVCGVPGGTGYNLFYTAPYKVAGKTGTALVANGKRGYVDRIYQSSFAGYFPANNPQYSCIVVIKNKPFAKKYYGGSVAGPVFREIADKLYALHADKDKNAPRIKTNKDSTYYQFAGNTQNLKTIASKLNFEIKDSASFHEWGKLESRVNQTIVKAQPIHEDQMPDVKGMGLKDAIALLEDLNLRVKVQGVGKVINQSLPAGSKIQQQQIVLLELQ